MEKVDYRGATALKIQGPPKNLLIYPISSIVHPNQTLGLRVGLRRIVR